MKMLNSPLNGKGCLEACKPPSVWHAALLPVCYCMCVFFFSSHLWLGVILGVIAGAQKHLIRGKVLWALPRREGLNPPFLYLSWLAIRNPLNGSSSSSVAIFWCPPCRLFSHLCSTSCCRLCRLCTAAADRRLRLLTSDLQDKHEIKVEQHLEHF